MKSKMMWAVLWCVAFTTYAGNEIKGVVTTVIDGNTIEVSATDREMYTVLLLGIDSPEPGQNFAEQSKKFLEKLLLNKAVTILIHGKDRKGNRLGEIHVDGVLDPSHELLKAGLAWTAEKEPNPELESLKEQARAGGKGLWKDENPTPPWVFRRQQSMMMQKSS